MTNRELLQIGTKVMAADKVGEIVRHFFDSEGFAYWVSYPGDENEYFTYAWDVEAI